MAMDEHQRDLVLDIYDTVADASCWPGVLDRVADAVGARGCIVFEMDGLGMGRRITAPFSSSSNDSDLLDKYLRACLAEEAADQAVFERYSAASDQIELIDDSVLAENQEALSRRRNVRLLRRMGIGHRAAGLLSKDNRLRGRFSVQLDVGRGRLNAEERAVAVTLMPHVAKAIELGRPAWQLAQERHALLAAIDRLSVGVAVLDNEGRIAHRNCEFDRQRQAYDVFQTDLGGCLRLSDDAGQARLAGLLSDALHHGRFGARPRKEAIILSDNEQPSALCIEVVPLDRSEELGSKQWGGALVFSLDTSLPTVADTQLIQTVFQFTDAETELTVLIGEGLTNREIADRRERSVETVNAQMKSLLSKTHCANRTQLVRLLTSFTSNLLSPG